jgi:FkbM family methyltransferase
MLKNYLYNFNINYVLDVGAFIGEYVDLIKSAKPDVYVFSVEANKDCEFLLKQKNPNSTIACLSEKKDKKIFYKTKENLICTGNSLYRENTKHYSDEKIICEEVDTISLDELLQIEQPNIKFDFLKIDTQGSELDILKGASKTLENIRLIVAETDVSGYNIGAPKQQEVIDYLSSVGFVVDSVIDNLIWDGKLLQQDLIFKKVI